MQGARDMEGAGMQSASRVHTYNTQLTCQGRNQLEIPQVNMEHWKMDNYITIFFSKLPNFFLDLNTFFLCGNFSDFLNSLKNELINVQVYVTVQ